MTKTNYSSTETQHLLHVRIKTSFFKDINDCSLMELGQNIPYVVTNLIKHL